MKSQRPQRRLVLIFFVLHCLICEAQESFTDLRAVEKHVQEYIQLSRLGPGYSRDMSKEVIDQFGALFEKDAFLCWDLFNSASESIALPLTFTEYIDHAKTTCHSRQPILDYTINETRFEPEGKSAIVFFTKVNLVMDDDDRPLRRIKIRLRMTISLDHKKPLIREISEEKKVTFISSIPLGINVVAWSNVLSSLAGAPIIHLAPNEAYTAFNSTTGIAIQYGAMLEMRINRNRGNGLLLSTGLFYSKTTLTASMQEYSKSYPDTIGQQQGNLFSCTTFERAPVVSEQTDVTKVEIPVLFKTYLSKWSYLKAGTALGFVRASTDVSYSLSRTGGGWVTNLSTLEQVYLDRDHEIDQAVYGYYRDKSYHFPKDKFVNKVVLSIQLAAGFEKQLGYFSFGIEPNVSFGMSPVSARSFAGKYPLTDLKGFNPVLESTITPAYEFTFGIRFLIRYLFLD